MAAKESRPVIICTEYRGVFYGLTTETDSDILTSQRVHLIDGRMAIYWGTERGVMELAATGPTRKSKISAKADVSLGKVTAVFQVSPEAQAVWEKVS
jgi:hypothetical protein